MKTKITIFALVIGLLVLFISGCKQQPGYYTVRDFEKVPKIDVHFHYSSPDARFVNYADSLNFRLLSPNVDAGKSIDSQLQITSLLRQWFPDQFAFFGTFKVDSFEQVGFAEKTIARINKCMNAGASGIKIWKNIGMVLKDRTGRFVMVDDQAFDPIFKYLENKNIPLMGHLGEPKDCWLPEDQMDLGNNRNYFHNHPEYHMFLHPEAPSYQDQINARDNLLKKHPKLDFIGAHLASLEWNLDELAKFFDRFPNATADMAARIGHIQFQSLADREKVRNFFINYQDRILYGTDLSVGEGDSNYSKITSGLHSTWLNQWVYLATDSTIIVNDLGKKEVKGLKLPCEVIDKIYFKNAERFFKTGKK